MHQKNSPSSSMTFIPKAVIFTELLLVNHTAARVAVSNYVS